MQKKKIYSLLVLLALVVISKTNAQFNIKVGYSGGFTKAPVLNGIVDRYNIKFGKADAPLEQFRSLHGLEIGLRYRLSRVGFEVSWNSMTDRNAVVGRPVTGPSTGVFFQDKYYLSLSEFSFGLENYFGNIGYGASIGYRTARMKTDITGSTKKKREVLSESGLCSKFYLIFQYPGDKVGIALKPYIQLPLADLNMRNFDTELNRELDGNTNYVAPDPQKEKFMMYGFSIVLYNGKQK